jgi:hypothetical protein
MSALDLRRFADTFLYDHPFAQRTKSISGGASLLQDRGNVERRDLIAEPAVGTVGENL